MAQTKEQRQEYINQWRKESRRKRGLQKQGRKPLSEEDKELSKEQRKVWEKEWKEIYLKENPQKRLLWAAKRRSVTQNLPFNIEESDINIPEHCPYLGITLQTSTPRGTNRDASMSLDRIIPELGYVKGNIEVISNLANTMKNSATQQQLLTFANSILKRHDLSL